MTPEIKEKLLGLINEKAYNPLKKEELALIFDIHSCEMPMFNNFLEELQDEGYLIVSKKGRVMAPSAMGYFVGKFISHRKGFGFVESDEEFTQDLFIGSDDINGAMNGDRVMAEIVKPAEEGRRAEGAGGAYTAASACRRDPRPYHRPYYGLKCNTEHNGRERPVLFLYVTHTLSEERSGCGCSGRWNRSKWAGAARYSESMRMMPERGKGLWKWG